MLGLTAVIAKNAPKTDEDVAHSLMTLFGWAGALWRTVFVATLVLTLVIVIDVLVQRRWRLARDLLVSALALIGTGAILGRVVASDWTPVELHVLSRWGYPELRVAAATAAIVVVAPELVRPIACLRLRSSRLRR